MKKILSLIFFCLGCYVFLEAQNVWKPIDAPGYILAVGSNGYLYSTSFDMGCLSRSTDEGLTWEPVFGNATITGGAHMTVSEQGRIFLVPELYQVVYYSDNNGGTWHNTSMFPACLVEGMYAASNDTLMIWGSDGCSPRKLCFTLDGGATWSSADISPMSETHHIGDVIVSESGEVFVSFWSNNAQNDGIYRSDLSDMQHWELVAFQNISIKDMEFNPAGDVVAVACAGEYNGFEHIPGFYLAGSMSESLGVADNGVEYIYRRHGGHIVLAYSNDQGAHFHEIGEQLSGASGTLFRGHDKYLYYFSGYSHWKSIDEVGYIDTNYNSFAPQGAEWYFNLPSFMGSNVSFYHIEVLGETLILGHRCSIISQQFLGGVDYQYVYEDNRKVYWYNSTIDDFTILYDFNAEVGDSWICEVDDCSYEIEVRSIEDILYEGHTYRVQIVAPVEGELFYYGKGYIIDGLGSVEGLFPYPSSCQGIAYDGPYPDFLRCYLVNGEEIYHQGFYSCDAVYPFNTNCWDGTIAESYEGGDGTEENPYQIATPQQLALLAQQINNGIGCTAHYVLVNDICLNDKDGTLEWPVIGLVSSSSDPSYFRGVFDGNGHIISGMYISEYHICSGLFGDVKGAIIKNLTVSNSRIITGNVMGFIAGEARNTDFLNCNVTSCEMITTVSSGGQGGIVGNVIAVNAETDTVFIMDCTSNVRFSSNGYSCGGIVGYACSQNCVLVIENCVNYSNVLGTEHLGGILGSGGVIGHDESSAFVVRDCKNFGDINLGQFGGGIGAYCWDIEVYRCFNRGDVTAGYNAGGIIGINMDGLVAECANMGNVQTVSTSGSMVGGIVGDHSGVVANSYNHGEVSAIYGDAGRDVTTIGGIVGKSTGSIYNVYNASAITLSDIPFNSRCGAILGQSDVSDHYMNCYWLEQDNLPSCGNVNLPDLLGSSAFTPGEVFNNWMLSEPQYGTDDLLEALNFGSSVVLDSLPEYLNLCVWRKDEYGINGGLPMFDFQDAPLIPFIQSEWYYEIQDVNGNISYQHLEYAGDTTISHKDVQIIIRTNTLYDKSRDIVVTHEYVYEEEGVVYWWNRDLHQFTTLYNLVAEIGDTWQIRVGTQSLIMHVDAIDSVEYNDRTFRVLHVSDANSLFSGDIVCGVGHQSSFFPERLMRNVEGLRVNGFRCYWIDEMIVFKNGDDDCDAIYSDIHGVEESKPTSIQFSLYPNPTDGVLNVSVRLPQCDSPTAARTYRITNLMGQTVLSGSLNAETQQIDVSNLPQGMYFITFAGETRKFVVK